MSSKGRTHYGPMYQPKCRPRAPFTYFSWSTWSRERVTCLKCKAWIERSDPGSPEASDERSLVVKWLRSTAARDVANGLGQFEILLDAARVIERGDHKATRPAPPS